MLIPIPRNYGIRGVAGNLIAPYLQHREQFVPPNSTISTSDDLLWGVLQGSILEPLLFVLYINDLFNVTNEAAFIAYADDMGLSFTGAGPDNITPGNNIMSSLKDCNK